MSNPIMSKDDFTLTVIMSILPACADKLEDFPSDNWQRRDRMKLSQQSADKMPCTWIKEI